ncbi:MAG TPA: carboxypeptidase-like regulatory domain-containing protein, partial [Bryobacteraceae bacterium]|nr:carboxypeptidase-like regulatory domain-containing protein [Bryobacteraceae bacterium]
MLTLLLTLRIPIAAYAQLASTTSLVGTVTDSAKASMAGVEILAANEATRETYNTTTNANGYFEIQFVKVGTYTISAHQAGFETMKKTGIIVEANQIVRTDFTMQVGKVTETLTV